MSTNAELQRRQAAACAPGAAARGKFIARAENAIIYDVEGRRFIDFAAGIARAQHRPPASQGDGGGGQAVEPFTHTCFHVAPYEYYVALAERLNALVDTGEEERRCSSPPGAEAVENAIKIARAYTKRPAVIAFSGGFHGRTLHGDGADRQGHALQAGLRPVPGRRLPRAVPAAVSRRSAKPTRSPISSGCSTPTSIRSRSPRSSSNRCRARAASTSRPSISARCARSATSTASC